MRGNWGGISSEQIRACNMTNEQKEAIRSQNNTIISQKGYRVNPWLPYPENPGLRSIDEIKGRISVMTALLNISFGAPVHIIKQWIEKHNLTKHLSAWEIEILNKDNKNLTELEISSLRWYLESLWALLWVATMVDSLEPEEHVGDNLVLLVPNLQHGENNDKITRQQNLQTEIAIYTMLDYYYRLHWYCVDERLKGENSKLNEGQIYERRKALEWVSDRDCDWDEIEMST